MVAIVSGNSLGLELTSLGSLGSKGLFGLPGQGGSGEQVYVNAATGNLVVQRRDEFLPAIKEYSPIERATADDPPLYLWYKAPPALGQDDKDPTHSANFGVKLKAKLDPLGVDCILYYPGAKDAAYTTLESYLIAKLRPEAL